MVQVTRITNGYDTTVDEACERIEGLTPDHARATPYLLFGTVDQIVEKLHEARDRWGITYFAVRERDAFAHVIRAVSTTS